MPRIRPAKAHDIPALLPLIYALAAHHDDPPNCTAASLERDVFGARPVLDLLVAHAETLIGYAALTHSAQLQWGVRGLDMHHLYVSPAHRGTGIGAALLQATLTHARALNCAYVTVSTHPDNHAAQAFYAHLGFQLRPSDAPRFVLRL
ncbi:GNAT family N-acetyltransferase [Pararhodobacter sp.]|uniref:GNAT family N-acetyltransferase n=1 Tax=Pararhodobacter sp. TaxID=2127056 RepID=UPI002B002763|nr:GNAT family N-acetyltransferase [Pararhodobacter sp.]